MPARTQIRVKKRATSGRTRNITLTNVLLAIIIIVLVGYIFYPAIKQYLYGGPFGNRLVNIDKPLSASQLGVINNAPNSYFETAAEMLLNNSIPGEQVSNNIYSAADFEAMLSRGTLENAYVIGGKPSVIYIGAISCIYCGESRWAMALALSRFGNFSELYLGYSSIGDGDVPTLYWNKDNIVSDNVTYGNKYTSPYINFISAEYDSNISQGFQLPNINDPIQYYINNAPNATYRDAMSYMNNTGAFQGTPFTLWGDSLDVGAAAVVFGVPNAQSSSSQKPQITYMTHAQILNQLSKFNSTLAIEEYVGADIYSAQICAAINNTASVCKLPAILAFESKMGLQ